MLPCRHQLAWMRRCSSRGACCSSAARVQRRGRRRLWLASCCCRASTGRLCRADGSCPVASHGARAQALFLRSRLPQAEAAARRCLALLQQGGAGSGDAAVAARLRFGAILMGARRGALQR